LEFRPHTAVKGKKEKDQVISFRTQLEQWNNGIMGNCSNSNDIVSSSQRSTIPKFQHSMEAE